MELIDLVTFVRERGMAVVSTLGPDGEPQSALVGIAATDDGELVFDTSRESRKFANVRRDPRISVVVGWDDEQTMQIEGVADVPSLADLDRCRAAYFAQWPDGVERAESSEIAHVRIRAGWARRADFRPESFGSDEATF